MPETITLSFSQVANQLTTHFNNFQEDRLYRNPERSDNFTHITPKSLPGSRTVSNLYPRSILYDYANGTGALDPHIFFENDAVSSLNIDNLEKIQTAPRISLNAYQKATESNLDSDIDVDKERTEFWSDFTRLTYNPANLLRHPEFNYDPQTGTGVSKNMQASKFIGHQLGIDSFHNIEEFEESVDENIRKMFEEAHNVNHVNVVVELDSAWSGVCSETIKHVIDDQLNGKGSKLLVWSLQKEGNTVLQYDNKQKLDRIRKLLSFVNSEIGGFIPLNLDLSLPSLMKNANSGWEKTAFLSIPLDFTNSIKDNDISGVLHQLTDGGLRKFINEVKLSWNDQTLDLGCRDIFTKTKGRYISHTFAKTVIANETYDAHEFSNFETLAKEGTPKMFLQNLKSKYSYHYVNTLPSEFKNAKLNAISLSTTNSLKNNFTDMYDFVSKFCRTDEREEFKDSVDMLREAYTFGFEPSDDDSDDDDA